MRRLPFRALGCAALLAGAAATGGAPTSAIATASVTGAILADGADVSGGLVDDATGVLLRATVAAPGPAPSGTVAFERFGGAGCMGPATPVGSAALATQTLAVPHLAEITNAGGWDSATTWNSNGIDMLATNWFGSLFAGNDLANFAASSMAWRFVGLPLASGDRVTRAYLSLRIWKSRPNLASEAYGTWSTVLATDTRDGGDFAGLTPAAFAARFNLRGAAWDVPFSYAESDPFRTRQGAIYAASPDITDLVAARLADASRRYGGALVAGALNDATQGIAEAAVDDAPDYARLHIEWTSWEDVQRTEVAQAALPPGAYSFRAQYGGDGSYAPAAGTCVALTVAPRDTDGDGYPDDQERALAKDPAVFCSIMRADVDGDGGVSILDLSIVADAFLQPVPPAPWRDDQGPPPRDSVITIIDLAAVADVYLRSVADCP